MNIQIYKYIQTCIVEDRTKQLSDYAPNTVHAAYLAIGCFYVLTACLFRHSQNVVNDAFDFVPKGAAKAMDYLDANIEVRRRHKLAKTIANPPKPQRRLNLVRMAAAAAIICHMADAVDLI
jgi:hypothetical protein